MLKLKHATKCSIFYSYILSCSAKIANSTLFYPLLSGLVRQCRTLGVVVPQISHGNAMTYLTVGTKGGIYTSPIPSQWSSFFSA
jgi:hypothetical protein